MKKIFLMGVMVIAFLIFMINCVVVTEPAKDGPSCQQGGTASACYDLIDSDSVSLTDFSSWCSSMGYTYSENGCDLSLFDVSGHCETSLLGFNSAIWYSSFFYTTILAEESCVIDAAGTWVQ